MDNADFDLQDILLEASAEMDDAMREILQEFSLPQLQRGSALMWAQLPDEMKDKFKNERPQEYAALMNALKGEKNG